MLNTGNGTSVSKNTAHIVTNVVLGVASAIAFCDMLYQSTISSHNHREAVMNSRLDEDTRAIKMQLGDEAQTEAIVAACAGLLLAGATFSSELCRQFRNS